MSSATRRIPDTRHPRLAARALPVLLAVACPLAWGALGYGVGQEGPAPSGGWPVAGDGPAALLTAILLLALTGYLWRQVLANAREVATRHEAQAAVDEHERRYRELVETVPAVVYRASVAVDGDATYVSPQIEQLLGYTPAEWTGTPGIWRRQIHPGDADRWSIHDQAALSGGAEGSITEYRMLTRAGETIWVRDVARIVRAADGRPVTWSGYLTDITDRKRLEEQLLDHAFRDPLTGLANRALFGDRIRHAVERQDRASGYVGMLMIDLDEFKGVNDTLGHAAGDQLLVEVGRRLRSELGPGTTVARLGGDEFAVLLEDLPDEAAGSAVAGQVLRSLDQPIRFGGSVIQARASIGVAVDLARRGTAEWLLRSADVAMYEAKRRGKNRWQTYDPAAYLEATRRAVIESGLRRAVERQQFEVVYQPLIDMETGRIMGTEALIRWHHPSRGVIAPGEFLAIAEKTGLIVPIGVQVLDRACAQARAWSETYPEFRAMSVNVSGRQLEGAALVDAVGNALAHHRVDPSGIVLEVTESVALEEDGPTLERLRDLKALGVRIAIDDFGTGYSSLAYLRRLPVDMLKIDRAFIVNVADDPDAAAVTRTIVELAKTLRLVTVAEGIEHPNQVAILRAIGCDIAQGFHYSRPLRPRGVDELLAQDRALGLRAVS